MPSLALARAANAAYTPTRPPVALFLGGTSGIGQAMAQALARYTKGNAHIILCGRNRAAAESTIDSFPKPSTPTPGSQYEFEPCDATLMQNVAATTSALLSRLPKVNFLVLSPGFLSMRGRDETREGIDRRLALTYYARWKFTHDLLPLLRKARDAGEDAKVVTVLGPGNGREIDLDDLGLKKNYSAVSAGMASPTYNDLMIEAFAEREPGISFIHVDPGVVRTPLLRTLVHNAVLASITTALIYPFSVSAAECAEYMLYALLHSESGAQRRDSKGNDMGKKGYYGSDEARKQLWDHTVEEIERAVGAQEQELA